jgi:sortase A
MKKIKDRIVVLIITLIIILILVFSIIYIVCNRNKLEVLLQDEEISTEDIETSTEELVGLGKLTIKKIDLIDAPIREGTDLNILENYIGHFSDSGVFSGNIALCSHNRGVENGSYFARLKDLEIGDEIEYTNKIGTFKYTVSEKNVIDETDLSVLQPTEDERLTLITCIANDKPHRLCVIAKKSAN